MAVPFVVAALLYVAALLVAVGRGDWMIAGYNTAGKEAKAKVNIKRLRLLITLLCLAVGTLVLVDGLVRLRNLYFTIIILWIIIPTAILANTWAMKK